MCFFPQHFGESETMAPFRIVDVVQCKVNGVTSTVCREILFEIGPIFGEFVVDVCLGLYGGSETYFY